MSPPEPTERVYLYVCPDCGAENWRYSTRLSKDLIPVACDECGRHLGADDRVPNAEWKSR